MEVKIFQRMASDDAKTDHCRAACLPQLRLCAIGQALPSQPDLTRQQTYTLVRVSSSDPTGRNADARTVAPGATYTVLDADGPAMISHIWFTIADDEPYNLKRIVLRIYWDNEKTPSVEAPIGDFFGLGLGEYHDWQSQVSIGRQRQGAELLFSHAVRQTCPHHRDQ